MGEISSTTPLEIFLEIKVPVISVILGNLNWFSEIPLMADIVLASERSTFNEFTLLREELAISSFVRRLFYDICWVSESDIFVMV